MLAAENALAGGFGIVVELMAMEGGCLVQALDQTLGMGALIKVDHDISGIDAGARREGIAQRHGHDQDEQRRHDEQREQAVPVAQQSDGFLEPEGEQAG